MSDSRASRSFRPALWTALTVAVVVLLFALSMRTSVRPAEATAALAAVEATFSGEANISYQLGEEDPRRLPLHTWVLGALALGSPDRVSVGAARGASFLVLVVTAWTAAAAFGSGRRAGVLLILWTPAFWAAATRGTPGALLAGLVTLSWAAYESGRRLGAPSLQWALPPILGAAASLVWSPAILFVALALVLEALRLARSREVAWVRLAVGALGAVAVIGVWRIAHSGFATQTASGWAIVDPVLASRSLGERLTGIALAWAPVAFLLIARAHGSASGERRCPRPGGGILLAAGAIALFGALAPGVPPELMLPAVAVAIGVLGACAPGTPRTENFLLVFLPVLIAAIVLHTPHRRSGLDDEPWAKIGADEVVVIDRELDVRTTWEIVRRLGRPARRTAPYGAAAWYVGYARVGPGLAVERPDAPEAWSLLGRPLLQPELPEETRERFARNLAAARDAYASNPNDALSAIWVGRRIAYLGRYREAIEWYGEAMQAHPDDSRFWRHRGHRYISVRQLDDAIDDLEYAVRSEQGREDRVEPDGLPNAAGIPTSTTQTNIWYHLGLAYYLQGDLQQTVRCYREYLERSDNDDSRVAGTHWLHIALRRLGRDAEAAELLAGLGDDMTIIENHSYHDLVMLYAGRLDAAELQDRLDRGDGPSQAALAYGLARWYDDHGDPQRAHEAYLRIVAEAPWAAFGTIAAEAELAARLDGERPVW